MKIVYIYAIAIFILIQLANFVTTGITQTQEFQLI